MNNIDSIIATDVVLKLLRGTQFDTIRVFSLIVQLGFVRTGLVQDLPQEVWIVLSGNLQVGNQTAPDFKPTPGDFFSRRANALSDCYHLIGKEVSDARVADSGTLEITLSKAKICVEADEEGDLEEIWGVMSETPNPMTEHQWYVSLDDSCRLSAHVPN